MFIARIQIHGVPVDRVTMGQALEAVDAMLAADTVRAVMAVNPEKVMKARHEPALLGALQRAGLLLPDGVGVVWAARLLGLGRMERVPGSELMPRLCERAARRGDRVFLFGGSPEVNERAAHALARRYPGIRIVGREHGYLKAEDMPGLIRRINDSQADILFVALGSPEQELWIDRYVSSLRVKVCQGVGGTFDVLAGRVRRAPELLRTCHLEWLYRLVSNPSRVGRQAALPRFAWLVLRELVVR